jgi:type 1 glutamine amidotransferase
MKALSQTTRRAPILWCCLICIPDSSSQICNAGLSPGTTAETRPRILIVASEPEYRTEVTLPKFAAEHLAADFQVSLVFADANDENSLSGIETLKDSDLLLLSARRRTLPPEQLQLIRDFVAAGKPVLGIRTANHAFHLRSKRPPEGRADWPTFDEEVIGGSYTNHRGAGPKTMITPADSAAAGHPILNGVNPAELIGNGSLYQVSPLHPTATPLLTGTIAKAPSEPIAWINRRRDGGFTFYTSMGHPDDFQEPAFNRMLKHAVVWLLQQR